MFKIFTLARLSDNNIIGLGNVFTLHSFGNELFVESTVTTEFCRNHVVISFYAMVLII